MVETMAEAFEVTFKQLEQRREKSVVRVIVERSLLKYRAYFSLAASSLLFCFP